MSGRGVRKVSERILQDGRALIITDPTIEAGRVPDGTLKVDPISGQIWLKTEGSDSWSPATVTGEGGIAVTRDATIEYETFIITEAHNVEDNTFTYMREDDSIRTVPISPEGYRVFELEEGHNYIVGKNKIEAIIDDTLHRSKATGGLIEFPEGELVGLTEEDLADGTKVVFRYILQYDITGEGQQPRFSISVEEPIGTKANDLWLAEEE